MINNDNLKEKAKKLPELPGVYLMKDSLENVIYIGKAKALKRRVVQYFYNLKNRPSKIEKLVLNIHDFQYITTDTELDALLLECKLIKDMKPAYNSLMKNTSRYCYIKINLSCAYGYPEVVLEKEEDSSYYFGPYSSQSLIKETLDNIFEVIPFIRCSKNPLKKSKCYGREFYNCRVVCGGILEQEKYHYNLLKLKEILNKENEDFLDILKGEMEAASLALSFEKAKLIRDTINNLSIITSLQGVIHLAKEMKSIIVINRIDENFLKIFCIKGNKILYKEKIKLEEFYRDLSVNAVKIKSIFLGNSMDTLSLTKEDIDEANIIYSYIKNKNKNLNFFLLDDKDIRNIQVIEKEIKKLVKFNE